MASNVGARRAKKQDNERPRPHRVQIVWPITTTVPLSAAEDLEAEAWSYSRELHVYVRRRSDRIPLFHARVLIKRA